MCHVHNNKEKAKNSGRIWFALVLCYINHCRLFNAKSCLCIYIEYIRCGLVFVLSHINHCRLLDAKSSIHIYQICKIWISFVFGYEPL